MGGFPEWRARHLACAERGRAWSSCWRTTTHLSEERTGCSNEDREVQIALNEWIRRCWFPLKGVPPLLFNWGRGSLWYTAMEAIVEASRQINIMILCFVLAEQTAHTSHFPKTGPFSTITSDNIKDNWCNVPRLKRVKLHFESNNDLQGDLCNIQVVQVREGFPKKMWKFLTAFAMKEGGGSRVPLRFPQFICLKTIYNHFLTTKMRFAHSLSFISCKYVVVILDNQWV